MLHPEVVGSNIQLRLSMADKEYIVVVVHFEFQIYIRIIQIFLQVITIIMSNDREEQIRLHHEKWKKWKMEMKMEDEKMKKEKEKPVQSAENYAAKIIGKLQQSSQNSSSNQISKFEKQFESNACSVCFELMIPPRNPITLFPCAHNMCKICLFLKGDQKLKAYTLKEKKCYLCGSPISNYAENKSLMNLICTYTDNKHLIEKQEEDLDDGQNQQNFDEDIVSRLRLRCEILEKQKKSIANMLIKERKQKKVFDDVMEKLTKQKKKNSEERTASEKQAKLIEDFLKEKRQQLEKIKVKISNAQQKKRVVQKTLEPLLTQKQKLLTLEAAKLLDR